MATEAEVGRAIVQIIPTMDGTGRTAVENGLKDAFDGLGDQSGKDFGEEFAPGLGDVLGKKLPGVLAGVISVASVTAISKALVDVGAEFDRMTDNIIIGTGASGAALADLEDSARAVARSLPVSFGDAGQTVADLNTRLGLTGDELTKLATRVSALGSFGQQLDINTMTGAMNAFGVSATDVADKLDYFWGVSQATGVSMDGLFGAIQANAPQLTALGFSIEESANMVGLLDKAGLNASSTMASMSKALVNLAEPGQDASEAFQGVLDSLAGYIEAGDRASALDLASTVFGTRGATKFVAAVESGALSLDALRDSALGASGSIMGTLDATMSWPEKFEIVKNRLLEAIEPLASALFDGLGGALDAVIAALDGIDPATMQAIGENLAMVATTAIPAFVDFAANTLPGIIEGIATIAPAVAGVLGAVGPLIPLVATLAGVVAPIVTALGTIIPALPAVGAGLAALTGPVGIVIGLVAAAAAGVIGLWTTSEEFRNAVTSIVTGIGDAIWGGLNAINDFFGNFGTNVSNIFGGIVDNVTAFGQGIVDFWSSIPDRILGFFRGIGDTIMGFFSGIKLPHFSLHGSINPLDWPAQGLPGITVEWYARGGYVNEPTVLGASGSSIAIGGEAGGEWVVPDNPGGYRRFGEGMLDAMGGDFSEIVALLTQIRDKDNTVVMDTGELVGATIAATDTGLGARSGWSSRGVAYA